MKSTVQATAGCGAARILTALVLAGGAGLVGSGCRGVVPDDTPRPYQLVEVGSEQRLYGPSGLERIAYDFDGDGRAEVVIHVSRQKPTWRELDSDADGVVDRWEYFRADGSVQKVAASRRNNGRPDEWTYPDREGRLTLRELDQDGDGRPDVWEYYRDGVEVAVRRDADRDGQPDGPAVAPGTPPAADPR